MNCFSKRGTSPVISSIVLSVIVLVIGASVWSFATSASSVIASDYFEELMEAVEKIEERFCIENIGYNDTSQTLKIWIYNYGKIDITIEAISVEGDGNVYFHSGVGLISAGELVRINVAPTTMSPLSGLSISIEVRSNRGNKAYDSVLVP